MISLHSDPISAPRALRESFVVSFFASGIFQLWEMWIFLSENKNRTVEIAFVKRENTTRKLTRKASSRVIWLESLSYTFSGCTLKVSLFRRENLENFQSVESEKSTFLKFFLKYLYSRAEIKWKKMNIGENLDNFEIFIQRMERNWKSLV